jgi:hypothetical protein
MRCSASARRTSSRSTSRPRSRGKALMTDGKSASMYKTLYYELIQSVDDRG